MAIQINIFVDSVSWRDPGGNLNIFLKSENLRLYLGLSLRFISKKIYNAIFRFDYSFQIFHKPEQTNVGLVFGIGQFF